MLRIKYIFFSGGAIQFPKDFIKRTSDMVRSQGGLTIMDEVYLIKNVFQI